MRYPWQTQKENWNSCYVILKIPNMGTKRRQHINKPKWQQRSSLSENTEREAKGQAKGGFEDCQLACGMSRWRGFALLFCFRIRIWKERGFRENQWHHFIWKQLRPCSGPHTCPRCRAMQEGQWSSTDRPLSLYFSLFISSCVCNIHTCLYT